MGGKKKKVTIGYKYFMGLHMGICRGPIDALRQIRVGDKVAWTGKLSNNSSIFINQPKLFGGEEQEGGIEGVLDVMTGHKDQQRNSRLSAMLGGLTSAFRGVATVFFDGLVCAMSPYPKEWSFLVQKTKAGWHNDECWYPEKCEMLMAQRLLISGSDRVWRYAVFDRSDSGNYAAPAFNDSAWQTGVTPFASSPWSLPGQYGFATAPATVVPPSKKVWMRTKLSLAEKPKNARFQAFVDNDCTLYINGVVRASVGGNNGAYYDVALSDDAFFVGENVIAVEGSDRHAGPGNWFWFDWRIVDSSALEVWGMNPAHILRRLYTDPSIGRGLPASRLDEDSWRAAADKFYAEGFGLCLKWARTGSIADFAAEVINHAGAVVYTSRRTGKIVLKAIRDDYDVNDLPLYTPDTGLLGFDDDEASAQTGGINEIVVNYKDPVAKADKAVREKNLGAIMAAGGITISESVDYPGIPTEALARRVARRDLQAKSGFIKRFSVRLDRRGRDIMPGGVFRISDTSRGIENMVLRAGRVEYGTITDGTITVTALQDVFGLPATVYREPEENAYVPPDTSIRAPVLQAAMEAPYRDLVQAMSASDLEILAPDAGYLHAAAVRPTTLSQSFALQTRVAPAAYTPAADMATFCPGGKLSAALDYLDTTAVLTDAQALDELQPGTAALIGGEIVRVDAVDVATATLTIARGCADTVPAQHAVGTAVLCYDNWGGDDQTEYTSGVSVDAQLLTSTGAGQLSPSAAPVQSVTFDSRAARPYPPGDVKLNGQRYPNEVTGDLEVTWAHRDRLLQADNLIETLQPSVGPEPGTTYAVELYDGASSTLLHSETGIASTTAAVPSSAFAYDNRLELYSVRGGLESWQRQVRRFTWGEPVLWTPALLDLAAWLDASALLESAGVGPVASWSSRLDAGLAAVTEYGSPQLLIDDDDLPVVDLTGAVMHFPSSQDAFKNLHSTGGSVFSVVRFGDSDNPNQMILLLSNSGGTATKVGVTLGYEDRSAVSQSNNSVCLRVGKGISTPLESRVSWDFDGNMTTFAQYRTRITPQEYLIGHWSTNPYSSTPHQRGRFSRNGDPLSGGNTFSNQPSSADAAHAAAINALAPGDRLAGTYGLPLKIRELIVTASPLSTIDAQRVEGYIAHKWGLASELPADHPYKHSPPTV